MSEKDKKDWHKFREENETLASEMEHEPEQLDEMDKEITEEDALVHPDYKELSEQLTLAEQKAHENWEKSVRALAELDNVRRRAEREVANAHRYGVEKLINGLLPVIDSLEQALQLANKEENAAMHEGLELTMKLFHDALQKFDVTQIDPVGEPFNPQEHEAMSMMEVPDAAPNSVVNVFQKGYKLSDRVIRPARVIVAKK
ncbi:MAG: nucleotide exchange factor GrpE [Legionella sp. 40-6]|nr:nucleotide exchange factor GrpE [Legionella sp.]OJY16275.1 MAG: nucleotide exchange factor GrpE [Legionella sp. 40-6]